MCPFRYLLILLGACGVIVYTGPLALGTLGASVKQRPPGWVNKTMMSLFIGLAILALHVDLLFSLGYSVCAFRWVADLHIPWRVGTA
eukprot:NODE_31547_length_394_cov_2.153558.p1 GENE.NODE_31547_length_394_cov_2.153558~~NODE_31547_length_394_cov_2.153558.p1  ORF type:complete len:87 (+),score=19.05 NODE_31547_length_394_cov_2.153558:106-366(+)